MRPLSFNFERVAETVKANDGTCRDQTGFPWMQIRDQGQHDYVYPLKLVIICPGSWVTKIRRINGDSKYAFLARL